MKASTHIIGGTALTLACLPYLQQNIGTNEVLFTTMALGGAYIGSLFPDLDHPKSRIGKVVPFISNPISRIFGHRKFMHSFTLLFLLATIVKVYNLSASLPKGFGEGFCLGFFSHVFLDCLTVNGAYCFWPIPKRIRLLTIQIKSKLGKTIVYLPNQILKLFGKRPLRAIAIRTGSTGEFIILVLLSVYSVIKGIQLFTPNVYAAFF